MFGIKSLPRLHSQLRLSKKFIFPTIHRLFTTQNNNIQGDKVIKDIVDYVFDYKLQSEEAMKTSRYVILDALGCAILALNFKECTKLLGPTVPGTVVPNGVRIPGTKYVLDPIQGAFNIGTMIRWLDFNDCWLAKEWGHPSDNLGAVLAIADYVSQKNMQEGKEPLLMRDVTKAMIKAHEIQGCLALENAFNMVGLDHVILVRIASTALATYLLGGNKQQTFNALSNAWLDNGVLRTYRHYPNTGSRKSWAAGDACQRAVFHAFNAIRGEMGYPTALTAPKWGFYDVVMGGKEFKFQRPYGEYVMENILFKVKYPAEFHAQTAVEAACALHPKVKDRLDDIKHVHITTQEPAIRIIDKKGPLKNPADRDHCIQYMTAIGLIFGDLTADHYEDDVAKDPRIDALREKMILKEQMSYNEDYYNPEKRAIPNAVQVEFKDGTFTERVEVLYPIGHRKRRAEAIPLIEKKFENNLRSYLDTDQTKWLMKVCFDATRFEETPVHDFMSYWEKQ